MILNISLKLERVTKTKTRKVEYFLSPCNIISNTNKVSSTRLPKCELNNDDINEHATLEGGNGMRPQPYTKNYGSKLRNARNGSGDLPTGKSISINSLHVISFRKINVKGHRSGYMEDLEGGRGGRNAELMHNL